jgi:DNA-binding MarR family transcriptional regulator
MLEFIKTVAEDGTFRYGRNVPDGDSDGGRTTKHVEREPLPVVFSFADENEAEAGKDQELRTRTVEVKVDENPEKNAAVHDMKWGGSGISLPSSDHNYVRTGATAEERAHAIKSHIRDMPTDINVVLPYGNGDYDGDDWCAAGVVRPMFNFGRSQSTRASANLAGLTMGSALLNYHIRDAACESCGAGFDAATAQQHDYECPECDDAALAIVAEAQDVGNLIACRPTLLAVTHGLTDKKFAVLDAIREAGGQANPSGTAVQATKQSIVQEIQDNDDIATLTKPEIEQILDELDEHLIINKRDNPEDRRQNLYVYDGSAVFEAPNVMDEYERFKSVADPIQEQSIEQTIDEQLADLNAKLDTASLTNDDAMGVQTDESGDSGLDAYSDDDDVELTETERAVAEQLSATLDGKRIPADVMADNSLKLAHMLGDAPIDVDGDVVRPEREPSGKDKVDGFLAPDGCFADADDFNEAEQQAAEAVETLRAEGVMAMNKQRDESVEVEITL